MNNLATVDPGDTAVPKFFVYGLLRSDYDGSPYTQSANLVAELAVREEFRADVTKTHNYPDCPVMPTLVGSVGVLAAGWGCRWWAGRDKPKLVEASNPRCRWPRDPDDIEDTQKRPLRDAMLELEGEPDGAALITRRASYDVLLDHA
jgi:hypothetical protein